MLVICYVKMPNLFLKKIIFRCARTKLFKLPLRIDFRLLFSSRFLVLYSSQVNLPLLSLSFRIRKIDSHRVEFDIASTKLLDKIVVPLLLKCSLDPFKCLYVIVSS